MKILYLCADLGVPLGGRKGASAHVRGLVGAFTTLGHEVHALASRTDGDAAIPVPSESIPLPEIAEALPEAENPRLTRALAHLWNNVAVERSLRKLLSRFPPDLIYERYSPFGAAGSLMAARLGIPHVLEVNAPLAWEGRHYRKQALPEAAGWLEETAFASTSLVIAVSRELRDALVEGGLPASKIAVVPNGVDVDLFAPEGEAHLEGFEGKLVLGFVGSLKPWHGIEVLCEAFRRLAADPRYHLLVVGKGPLGKAVQALADELPGRVTQAGAVAHHHVPTYLRAMDIALAPYPPLERFYYSPLKVLEYMAAARAIVAARIGQLTELVRPGETGLLVEPGDPEALAQAIRALAADEALRNALGSTAAREARRSHRWTDRALSIMERVKGLS